MCNTPQVAVIRSGDRALGRKARGSGFCAPQKIKATLPPIFRARVCFRPKTARPWPCRRDRTKKQSRNKERSVLNLVMRSRTPLAPVAGGLDPLGLHAAFLDQMGAQRLRNAGFASHPGINVTARQGQGLQAVQQ